MTPASAALAEATAAGPASAAATVPAPEPRPGDFPKQLRHIRVRVGTLTLDYIASAAQADDVARILRTCHAELEVTVVVDDEIRADLPSLPCSKLWDGPPCQAKRGGGERIRAT
ncbi:hypothetical protein ACWEKT_07695 [Nocardia takedensis]